jgi:hypothetical protein
VLDALKHVNEEQERPSYSSLWSSVDGPVILTLASDDVFAIGMLVPSLCLGRECSVVNRQDLSVLKLLQASSTARLVVSHSVHSGGGQERCLQKQRFEAPPFDELYR